jgi:hypothetical protein
MELDYGQFIDLSNMSADRRKELFPFLNTKGWRGLDERFFLLFRYPSGYYDDDVDEDEDYYDAYGCDSDSRAKWIESLKDDGVTQQIYIDSLGSW